MCKIKYKKCIICGEEKPLTKQYFHSRKDSKDGFRNNCKECKSLKDRKTYLKNQEQVKERSKKYHHENRDEILEKRRKYYQENKELYSQRASEYYLENREKILNRVQIYKDKHPESLRRWREQNKDHVRKYNMRYKKRRMMEDPLFDFTIRIRKVVSSSFRRRKIPKNSNASVIVGCDWEFFKKYIESQFKEGMTWDNHGEWHYDHIIPLSTATNEEEVIKLNHYTNFKPLWADENLKKSNNISEEWGNVLVD